VGAPAQETARLVKDTHAQVKAARVGAANMGEARPGVADGGEGGDFARLLGDFTDRLAMMDPATLGPSLSAGDWRQFEAAVATTVSFFEAALHARHHPTTDAQDNALDTANGAGDGRVDGTYEPTPATEVARAV
jgi:hypothetical protein